MCVKKLNNVLKHVRMRFELRMFYYHDNVIQCCYIDDGDAIAMARTMTLFFSSRSLCNNTQGVHMSRADGITSFSYPHGARGCDFITQSAGLITSPAYAYA